MNKTINRRNPYMHVTPHCRVNRRQARLDAMQKWWERSNERDAVLWWSWSRQEKKQFLLPGPTAYDKWNHRFAKLKLRDPSIDLVCGRHVLAPVDACWSVDRKFKFSLVKVNAQGRRRKF